MRLKRLVVTLGAIVLLFLTVIYVYVNQNEVVLIGVGIDSKNNEVLLDFNNNSILPIFVKNVIVKNEANTDINGSKFMYRLNSNQTMVFSDELQEFKNDLEFVEPYTTLYLPSNKNEKQNSIFIKDGEFKKISKVEVKIKIFGFIPFHIVKNVDLEKISD